MSNKQGAGEFSEEVIYEYLKRVRHFFVKNKTKILFVLALGVLLAVFIVFRAIEAKNAEEEASTAFERVSYMLRDENVKERISDIDTQLEDIIRKWPGTLAAARASFYLGRIQYDLNNFAGAIESYTRASRYSSSIYLYPAAILGIANACEQTGDTEDAIEQYERIETLGSASFGYENVARLGRARCLAVKGNFAEARRLLDLVRSARSHFSEEADQMLVWLDGLEGSKDTPLVPGN
jgi:predicted negative regulator of RcsB-dependent stress response